MIRKVLNFESILLELFFKLSVVSLQMGEEGINQWVFWITQLWWNHLRPVHAILYLVVAISLLNDKNTVTFVALLLDVIIGVIGVILHESELRS